MSQVGCNRSTISDHPLACFFEAQLQTSTLDQLLFGFIDCMEKQHENPFALISITGDQQHWVKHQLIGHMWPRERRCPLMGKLSSGRWSLISVPHGCSCYVVRNLCVSDHSSLVACVFFEASQCKGTTPHESSTFISHRSLMNCSQERTSEDFRIWFTTGCFCQNWKSSAK